jgi:hypothetical protein
VLADEVINLWQLEINRHNCLTEGKMRVVGEVVNAWLEVDGKRTRIGKIRCNKIYV